MATSLRSRTATGVFVLFRLPIGTMFPWKAAAADPAASPTPHRVYSHSLFGNIHTDDATVRREEAHVGNFGNCTPTSTSLPTWTQCIRGDLAADYVKDLD